MPSNYTSPNAELEKDNQYDEQVVSIDRVARVVKGGRRFRFRALVVTGDHKSKVGVGVSKGGDVQSAIAKAATKARKNLIDVPVRNGTIPHDITLKYSGSHVVLRPASPGTGLIAGGVVRTVLELGGIQNALSKSLGSSNKINTAYATHQALGALVSADQWITTKNDNKLKKKVAKK